MQQAALRPHEAARRQRAAEEAQVEAVELRDAEAPQAVVALPASATEAPSPCLWSDDHQPSRLPVSSLEQEGARGEAKCKSPKSELRLQKPEKHCRD